MKLLTFGGREDNCRYGSAGDRSTPGLASRNAVYMPRRKPETCAGAILKQIDLMN